uniref:Uncharacterized protein n=1 Tax=uncultured Planctomycetota bacterium TaxID=120965 RepID=H5SFR0_9BACT|nr:hypothetical protein HGMM_F22C11C11 [uncultured Planctomycetota bacterium]
MQVIQKCAQDLIQDRAVAVLQDFEIAVMQIPAAIAGIFFSLDVIAPIDLHKRDAVLNESAGQQTRLAEARQAVPLPQPHRLLTQIEEAQSLTPQKHFQSLPLVGVESGNRLGGIEPTTNLVQLGQK